jgi:hypothetical protein
MMFWIGMACGAVGVVIGVVAFVAFVLWRIRVRRRKFLSMGDWISKRARKMSVRNKKLIRHLSQIKGKVDIKVSNTGPKQLTAEQHGMVLLLNGIDVLVRQTNVDPEVIDHMFQFGLEYATHAAGEKTPEEPS